MAGDAESMGRAAWDRGEAAAAAGDIAAGRQWLERAHRLVPADQNLAFSLGLMRLRDGDPAGAHPLFANIATAYGGREAWTALTHCSLALNDAVGARTALHQLLAGYVLYPATEALARRLVAAGLLTAWCGLRTDGVLAGDFAGGAVTMDLDGAGITGAPGAALPHGWRTAIFLNVRQSGHAVVGSPVSIASMWRIEGFVAAGPGGLRGWAWHPGAPDIDPMLRVLDGAGRQIAALTATDLSAAVSGAAPLARPRGFTADGLPAGMLRVIGPELRDLLGSPLSLEVTKLPARPRARPAHPPGPGRVPSRLCIVIPVYRGRQETLDCIAAVLASKRKTDRLVVVNDASPDSALVAGLENLAAQGDITLIPSCIDAPVRNLGFPGAANAGLRAAGGLDVVLLNSDTLVFRGGLQALQKAVHAAPDIGTATPLSNDATIFSYPHVAAGQPNPMPSPAEGAALAALAAQLHAGLTVDVPTAHGFCMVIRADCLAATGLLREDVFAQGYGEENDFTERARAAGFRHVAVPSVYVAHRGGVSFGAARTDLLLRNQHLLARLHPGYQRRVAAFIKADPLHPARARLDLARLHAAPCGKGSVLLVTHTRGGGTARVVRARAAALRAQGLRPVMLMGQDGVTGIETEDAVFPNLAFTLPAGLPALMDALRPLSPVAMEVHQLLGHHHDITGLARAFGIPTDIWLHDYAWLCPRVSFVNADGRFCGEAPPDVCKTCLAASFRVIQDRIAPAALRRRSAADLAAARHVMVPHQDGAARLRRHFPGIAPVVAPLQDDAAIPPRAAPPRGDRLLVAVVGAIGLAKGFDVLLACARDAAARRLKLDFVVAGYTTDDEAMLATGHVFVTGAFTEAESADFIRRQSASIGFLPSIWPETWCYALTDMWQAGLDVALFGIGAPAARVRRTGRGWVLPLGLPPGRVNDALLNLQPLGDTSVLSQLAGVDPPR